MIFWGIVFEWRGVTDERVERLRHELQEESTGISRFHDILYELGMLKEELRMSDKKQGDKKQTEFERRWIADERVERLMYELEGEAMSHTRFSEIIDELCILKQELKNG